MVIRCGQAKLFGFLDYFLCKEKPNVLDFGEPLIISTAVFHLSFRKWNCVSRNGRRAHSNAASLPRQSGRGFQIYLESLVHSVMKNGREIRFSNAEFHLIKIQFITFSSMEANHCLLYYFNFAAYVLERNWYFHYLHENKPIKTRRMYSGLQPVPISEHIKVSDLRHWKILFNQKRRYGPC